MLIFTLARWNRSALHVYNVLTLTDTQPVQSQPTDQYFATFLAPQALCVSGIAGTILQSIVGLTIGNAVHICRTLKNRRTRGRRQSGLCGGGRVGSGNGGGGCGQRRRYKSGLYCCGRVGSVAGCRHKSGLYCSWRVGSGIGGAG
jgi:hypothetical protein